MFGCKITNALESTATRTALPQIVFTLTAVNVENCGTTKRLSKSALLVIQQNGSARMPSLL